MKKIVLLGATGSVGRSTISLIDDNKQDFELIGVCCQKNIDAMRKIISSHPSIHFCYIESQEGTEILKKEFPSVVFYNQEEGILKLLEDSSCDLLVNALVGFAGLLPTVKAIELNLDVALANKETLVVGGELINKLLKEHPLSHLYPIDSEHVALSKCLKAKKDTDVLRLILTASGGSFRDLSREELQNVTVEDALKHPSWSMGDKITIDSATMINKGFEIIEAHYLFGIPEERIDVLLHDESVIHSMIECSDHSFVADLGIADMRIPISYAIYGECYHHNDLPSLDLEKMQTLHFRKLDNKRYPGLSLARRALKTKGTLPCVLNAANEACNLAFRTNKLKFNRIEAIIEKVMDSHRIIDNPTLEDLVYVNSWAYQEAWRLIEEEM